MPSLIALLLRTGLKASRCLQLAQQLLDRFGASRACCMRRRTT